MQLGIHFLEILSYLHLFVSYSGYCKMAVNNISVEYNLDENSNSEGYKNEDIGDNESIVPDYDPDSSDIEVSSVVPSKVSSDHTDLGDNWMIMDLMPLMMLLLLQMQTFLTGQLTSQTY